MWQIREQITQEAPAYGLDPASVTGRLMYGVGSRLISSHGYPSLGGVYKLVAIESESGMKPAMKISDTPEKMPIPGDKQLWRIYDRRGLATADLVSRGDEDVVPDTEIRAHHPHRPSLTRTLAPEDTHEVESLLTEVFDDGARTAEPESLDVMRNRRATDLDRLDVGVRRLVNPHRYHVSVTDAVSDLQQELVERARA